MRIDGGILQDCV